MRKSSLAYPGKRLYVKIIKENRVNEDNASDITDVSANLVHARSKRSDVSLHITYFAKQNHTRRQRKIVSTSDRRKQEYIRAPLTAHIWSPLSLR